MPDRPRYMISVAAELVGMHPQTLRMYEAKGLVRPSRTPGGTRLYSDADVARLRLIQRLTTELGLNLAGVQHVLRLEDELKRAQARMERLERDGGFLARQLTAPVRWTESIRTLLDDEGCTEFVEIGPGNTLSNLVKRIARGTPTTRVEL